MKLNKDILILTRFNSFINIKISQKSEMSYNDDQIRNAVNAVFDAYDKDKSGTLEPNQITLLINDALKHMKQNRQVTQE